MTDSNGRRRVVVTGVGVVSAIGHDVDTFWDALKAGKSGVTPLPLEDIDDYPCRIGATVQDFDPTTYMDRKESRRMARFAQLAVVAAGEALESSGLGRLDSLSDDERTRHGVLLGTGIGGYPETEAAARVMVKRSGTRISPYYIPMMLPNMAAANVSRVYGATGYIGTTITAMLASFSTGVPAAVTVALAHLSFNILGIAIFYPLRAAPIWMAEKVGAYAARTKVSSAGVITVYAVLHVIPIIYFIL